MFKLLKKLGKKNIALIIISFLLVIVQVNLELMIPDYMSSITSLIQRDDTVIKDIIIEGAYMLGCAFGSLITAVIVGYFSSLVAANSSLLIRSRIFKKVNSFSSEEIKKFKTSSLITRTTNDVTQIEMFIAMGMQMIFRSPIMAFLAVSKIINKSVKWSMLTLGCVIVLMGIISALMFIVVPRFSIVQKLIDRINGVTRENLTGIRVIRAFNAEKYQQDRFEEVNNDLTKNQMFNQKCFAILNPAMNIVMHGLTLGIYFIGAFLIQSATISGKISLFSDMIVFSSYGMQVIMSFVMLAFIFMIWPRAQVSAKRINEILDQPLSIVDGSNDVSKTELQGVVEFKNVSFKYPDADEYLLENISFKVNRGETIAFIGSTGSGKSTLINLVPRFYDATCGEILVDGINVKDYTQESLNKKLGYVPQKAVMFTGTVKSNVSYGDKVIAEDKVEEAIEVAQASEFVNNMPDKVNSYIASGGTNVSGGQKQRLAIARAIARDPEIYIFDDSFSALDYKTDSVLRKALKKYTKDATCMIVAQRIGTIINADKIVVLDKGKCVGIGTHNELLKNCKVYKEIALSQLSKEELNNA